MVGDSITLGSNLNNTSVLSACNTQFPCKCAVAANSSSMLRALTPASKSACDGGGRNLSKWDSSTKVATCVIKLTCKREAVSERISVGFIGSSRCRGRAYEQRYDRKILHLQFNELKY